MTSESDPYEIALPRTARHAWTEGLPPVAAAAAWELISGPLCTAPYRVGKPLHEPFGELRSARRGTYRVLYRIDEDKHQVVVRDIQHRRDADRS